MSLWHFKFHCICFENETNFFLLKSDDVSIHIKKRTRKTQQISRWRTLNKCNWTSIKLSFIIFRRNDKTNSIIWIWNRNENSFHECAFNRSICHFFSSFQIRIVFKCKSIIHLFHSIAAICDGKQRMHSHLSSSCSLW